MNTQRTFFGPDVPHRDADTSIAAAQFIRPLVQPMENKVLFALGLRGERGATVDELVDLLELRNRNNVAPRCTALRDKGLIRDSGKRRKVPGQRCAAIVWVAT